MKYFSIFSGVGGFELGMQDHECIGFSEIDSHASAVLAYRFPNIKNYGDITKINTNELPDFDILVGGSPCQDLSVAGSQKGLAGNKSGLFYHYVEILKTKKPKYFIWENVKGAFSSNQGWDFAEIQIEFSEAGYDITWQLLNAKDFGVPQNRERIFIIGYLRGTGRGEVLHIRRNPKQTLNFVGGIASERKWIDDGKNYSRNFPQGQRVYGSDGIATSLTSGSGGVGGKTGLYAVTVSRNHKNGNRSIKTTDGMSTITATYYKGIQADGRPAVAVLAPNRIKKSQNGRRFKTNNEPMFTLTMQDRHGVYDGIRIRRLTPLECERLMSWPDNWTKYGNYDGMIKEVSDTQRYKMCGNGVVSAVVKHLMPLLQSDV